MVEINLLPWRQRVTEAKQKKISILLRGSIVMVLLIWLLSHGILSSFIKHRQVDLDEHVALQSHAQNEESVGLIKAAQQVQATQRSFVKMLDKLVLAEQVQDVQFLKLTYEGSQLSLIGYARALPIFLNWSGQLSQHYNVKILSVSTVNQANHLQFHLLVQ